MDWITDQIAIGNYVDAETLPIGVDAVLCLRKYCCKRLRTDVDVLCIPILDGPGNDPLLVKKAIDYISGVIAAGQRILVHCHAGRSRSVVVVARYLIETRGMTQHSALALIAKKREIYLSDGIEDLFIR